MDNTKIIKNPRDEKIELLTEIRGRYEKKNKTYLDPGYLQGIKEAIAVVDEYIEKETRRKTIDGLEDNERYKTFIFFDEPVIFSDFFKNVNFDLVQIHDMSPIFTDDGHTDIIGFAGVCKWEDGELSSEDGDSYSKYMSIWGYEEFENDGMKCIDVLSDNW